MEPGVSGAYGDHDLADLLKSCNLTSMSGLCNKTHPDWTSLHDGGPEAVIVPCLFAVILIVGVVGNTLLILSFAKHKNLSTPHNALVVNLASGDFIFLIVSLPFNMMIYTLPNWPFGMVICKLSHFAEYLAMAVVISTLSAVSIERCLIVTGKKLLRHQHRGPMWLAITIWTISLLVSMPSLISANVVNKVINNETFTFCAIYDESWGTIYSSAHVIFTYIFLFCTPFLIIATAYILIAVHLLLRAFPLSQRNIKSRTPNKKIFLLCSSRQTSKIDTSGNSKRTGTEKQVSDAETKTEGTVSKAKETMTYLQPHSKSNSPKKDNDKSSPDSCTETTELQQTPVLPYSFVYTGPIPTEAISKQEANYRKLTSSTQERKTSSDSPRSSPQTSSIRSRKETTPLNPSSNGEVKSGYKQRQQSIVIKRRRLALTVLMLIIAFAICWIPRHIYLLWYHLNPENYNTFWHVFKIIGFCLSSSNSAVNPVVFYILDSTYRSFVHQALCKICMRKCRSKSGSAGEADISLGDRDYNATIAMTDMKSKSPITEL